LVGLTIDGWIISVPEAKLALLLATEPTSPTVSGGF
jgi:hypothetical protein